MPATPIACAGLQPTDTDTCFAAAVLQGRGGLYFAPSRARAVAALATPLAATPHVRGLPARAPPRTGLGTGILIVAGLMGTFG